MREHGLHQQGYVQVAEPGQAKRVMHNPGTWKELSKIRKGSTPIVSGEKQILSSYHGQPL